jgi:MFS family permease
MPNGLWLAGLGVSRRQLFVVFFLLFNAFTWYYMILRLMESIPATANMLSAFQIVFHLAAIGSSLAGAVLSDKTRRLHIIYLWMIAGAVTPLLLTSTYGLAAGHLSIVFILLGVSFGVGMPSCLGYLADNTSVDNRGRISAISFLLINLSAPPLMILADAFDLSMNSLILAAWKGLGFIILVLIMPKQERPLETQKSLSFSTVVHDKSFALYLIPWSMFCIIDALETALLKDFVGPDFYELTFMISPIIASFSILLAGLLSDRIGRKRVVIYGFISLGVAYAIIGMAPMLALAWYFYLAIDAIAAGILWITFLMILWGDLSPRGRREKYYVVGSLPFFANALLSSSVIPISTLLPPSAAFSLASFFLFLAVLPLMYAPETLPQKKIELRRLRGYVEQAKKLAGKRVDQTDDDKEQA